MEKLWNIWSGPVADQRNAFWNAAKKRSVFKNMYVLKVFKVAESVGWQARPALIEAISSGFNVPGGTAIAPAGSCGCRGACREGACKSPVAAVAT